MIGFLEGAMLCGSSTAIFTAATCSCLPDGRTALLDFGITGRLDDSAAGPSSASWWGPPSTTCEGRWRACGDLGTLPPDTDLDASSPTSASTAPRSTPPR